MSLGLIVKTGRILTARLLMGEPIDGITHCAIGDGDATFIDPINPPAPDIDHTVLKTERARKKYYKRTFLKEDSEGTLVVNGIHYIETAEETQTIGVFFRFEESEANGITIRSRKAKPMASPSGSTDFSVVMWPISTVFNRITRRMVFTTRTPIRAAKCSRPGTCTK